MRRPRVSSPGINQLERRWDLHGKDRHGQTIPNSMQRRRKVPALSAGADHHNHVHLWAEF